MLTEFKKLRLTQGLRQVDVAEQTGIPQPRISLIERGLCPSKQETQVLLNVLTQDKNSHDRP